MEVLKYKNKIKKNNSTHQIQNQNTTETKKNYTKIQNTEAWILLLLISNGCSVDRVWVCVCVCVCVGVWVEGCTVDYMRVCEYYLHTYIHFNMCNK